MCALIDCWVHLVLFSLLVRMFHVTLLLPLLLLIMSYDSSLLCNGSP